MPEKDLHAGHRKRLKARFRADGLDGFEPHNMLELLLFYAVPRVDTNETAHRLIARFGSFSEVLDAPYEELLRVPGITENAATLLKLVPQLSRVYLEGRRPVGEALDTPRVLGAYFCERFVGRTRECVFLLCLDSSLGAIACEMLCEGSAIAANLDTKRIVERALRHNAARVVLAHNHPRGLASPSNEDILVTSRLKKALALLELELVDHIIVAGNEYYSVMEHYPDL